MSNSLPGRLLVSAVTLVAGTTMALAQTPVVVTNQAALIAGGNAAPAPFTNNFTGTAVGGAVNTINFSGSAGAFTYSYNSTGGSYLSGTGTGEFIGTNTSNNPITFNFTSGNVTGIGGRFFHTDVADAVVAQPINLTFTLSNTTTYVHPAYTPADINEYRGFLFNNLPGGVTVTSMTIAAQGAGNFASLDDFTVLVATPVPEPASMLLGVGVVGLAGAAWRRRRNQSIA